MDRPVDEIVEIGGQRSAVQVGRGDAYEGAGEAAMGLAAAAFVRQDRGVKDRADGLELLAFQRVEELQFAAADGQIRRRAWRKTECAYTNGSRQAA